MPDQLLSYPLAQVLNDLATPRGIHRLAASPLPDLSGVSKSIRADLGVQFRLNLPTELDGLPGHATVRYRAPIPIPGAEPIDAPDHLEAGMRVRVRLVAMTRTQDAHQRTHQRPVYDEDAEAWAAALFERHGLEADSFTITSRWSVGRASRAQGGGGVRDPSFTLRDVAALLRTTPLSQDSYLRGIGRGRAYGYGMLIAR